MVSKPDTVRTEVDTLLELIKRKREISFEDASRALGMPIQTIEAWASFLEEENLVAIKYKFTTPFFIYKPNSASSGTGQISSFVAVNEMASILDDMVVNIRKKDLEGLKQQSNQLGSKLSGLPAVFTAQNEDAINSINQLNSKLQDNLLSILSGNAPYEDSRGELEYLQTQIKDRLLKIGSSPSERASHSQKKESIGPAGIQKNTALDDSASLVPERTDIRQIILALSNLLNRFTTSRENREFDKMAKIYMELESKLQLLKSEVDLDCGLDQQAQKKLRKGIEQTGKLMETAALMQAQNNIPAAFESYVKTDEILRDLAFLLRTIYEEKRLIEKKEIIRSEMENIEPLLEKVYAYIKEGKFDSAKELYSELEEKYVMLPTEFIEKKSMLKKDLIKLNRDLALSIAEKSRLEMNAKSKAISQMAAEALSSLMKSDLQTAGEIYDRIESLYHELPDGFISEKSRLQQKILELQEKLINRKKDAYQADLAAKSARINSFLSDISKLVSKGDVKSCLNLYQQVRYAFGTLPEGFLEEKTRIQNKILSVHKEILDLKTQQSIKEMQEKSARINDLLMKASELVAKNDIKSAGQLYDEIEDIYRGLPSGFLVKKTEIQNRILLISSNISKKLDALSTAEFQKRTTKIRNQLTVVSSYLKKGEHDIALAEYEEIVNSYNQLPPGYLEEKAKLRSEMLAWYKSIVSSTDAFLVDDMSSEAKKRYDEILRNLVKMHHHIDAQEFSVLPALYDRISELYNGLPVGFVQKKAKIINDIISMYKKIEMYQMCTELGNHVRQRDFEGLRKKLELIYVLYNSLLDGNHEDIQLFNFVNSKYFAYRKILEEEQRIKGGILRTDAPSALPENMPQGNASDISNLQQKIVKAESHVSSLNFGLVNPLNGNEAKKA